MTTIEYLEQLVAFESTSSLSNLGISDYVEGVLQGLGFETERLEYDDSNGIRKASIVGKRSNGSASTGGMAYSGHTDVVPATDWFQPEHGPYKAVIDSGRLHARGSADMKGSIACMLAAIERVDGASQTAPIYFLASADEEIGFGGAIDIVARSKFFREMVEHDTNTIVGEPTELEVVYSHKGACKLIATSHGRAAHSSTREGINANLAMIPFLSVMKEIYDETETDPKWHNNDFDPPTITMNIGINDHTDATNITPPESICTVHSRPMPGTDMTSIIDRAQAAAAAAGIDLKVETEAGPFATDKESAIVQDMLEIAGKSQAHTVGYGTDASPMSALRNLVVFGPGNIFQGHTNNEWIALEQLEAGTDTFEKLIRHWCV
jgi:acetylornithine deacetylase